MSNDYDGKAAAYICTDLPVGTMIASRTFEKAIIRVGDFIQGEQKHSITQKVLQHWVAQFQAMSANGIKVPLPVGHTDDDAANAGWVSDMSIKGDELVATINIEDGKESLVESHDVSIYAPESLIDGEGRTYMNPIEHVALVSSPLINKLGDWVEIAASRVPVMTAQIAQEETIKEEDTKNVEPIKAQTEDPETPTEDEPAEEPTVEDEEEDKPPTLEDVVAQLELLAARIATLEDSQNADESTETPEDDEETAELAASMRKEWPRFVKIIAEIDANTMTDEVVVLKASIRAQELNSLVRDGKLTPACATRLTELAETKAIKASRKDNAMIDTVLDILKDNAPVRFGSKTGAQLNRLPGGPSSGAAGLKDAVKRHNKQRKV